MSATQEAISPFAVPALRRRHKEDENDTGGVNVSPRQTAENEAALAKAIEGLAGGMQSFGDKIQGFGEKIDRLPAQPQASNNRSFLIGVATLMLAVLVYCLSLTRDYTELKTNVTNMLNRQLEDRQTLKEGIEYMKTQNEIMGKQLTRIDTKLENDDKKGRR